MDGALCVLQKKIHADRSSQYNGRNFSVLVETRSLVKEWLQPVYASNPSRGFRPYINHGNEYHMLVERDGCVNCSRVDEFGNWKKWGWHMHSALSSIQTMQHRSAWMYHHLVPGYRYRCVGFYLQPSDSCKTTLLHSNQEKTEVSWCYSNWEGSRRTYVRYYQIYNSWGQRAQIHL